MNKIFKIVWSKARGCYVVASEFAKSHTKSGRAVKAVAVAVAAALTVGMNGLALAADGDDETKGNTTGKGNGVAIGGKVDDESGEDTRANAVNKSDIAIGEGAVADGVLYEEKDKDGNIIEIHGHNATAVGVMANATGANNTAIGAYAEATGELGSTALGNGAEATNNNATALGTASLASGLNSTAVGISAHATSGGSTALGVGTRAEASNSTALGNGAIITVGASNGTALGNGATIYAGALNGTALGTGATILEKAEHATAVGVGAYVKKTGGTSLGNGAGAEGESSTALGTNAKALGDLGTALGITSKAVGGNSTALGAHSWAIAKRSTAVGKFSLTYGDSGVAVGIHSFSGSYSAIAQGDNARAYDAYTIAIGREAVAGSGSIETNNGESWKTDKDGKLIFDNDSDWDASNAIAVGNEAKALKKSSVALGYKANVQSDNNVALGASSNDNYGVKGYYSKDNSNLDEKIFALSDKDAKVKLTVKVSDFAGVGNNVVGTVSVGYGDSKRTLTNVAAGFISEDSTDAINGSQLYQITKGLENLQDQINNINTGGTNQYHTVNGNDKDPDKGEKPDSPLINSGNWTSSGNLLIKGDKNETTGDTSYDISLNKDLKDINSIEVNNKITVGDKITINGDDNSVNIGSTTITENNVKFDNNHYFSNTEFKMGDTVINDNSVKVGDTLNIDNSKKEITVGPNVDIDMGGNQIHNVQAGTSDTDAVNVSQLKQVEQNVTNNSVQINKLKGRIDKVGAGAAALAALHPLDFDPDDKFYLSAGYGNYRGENAVAVGAFYQPNDDTLFSVSSTVGNDDDMINAGITWRFGQQSHQSRSKKAMAKEIIELRTRLASLEAMIYSMAGAGLDPEKSKLFPDTPENHWAYDYVAVVAGNGTLEGYPNGRFDGSRPMTRYEMAAVVYRLLQKGVQVDNRMIQEFAPELARVRVDTLTHYNDGTPHIQRVRVIKGRG